MDAITGATLNVALMTGANNANTTNDVMAERNTAHETRATQGTSNQYNQNNDVMAAQATATNTNSGSQDGGYEAFPENGSELNISA